MAYNTYFPTNYNPGYGYQFQQPVQPVQAMQQMQYGQQAPQIQNGGFVSVRGIEEAFNWPVAPGNSIMFKDENAPYVYTKTKGFSQLDQPIFERYRLVKEEDTVQGSKTAQNEPVARQNYEEQIKLLWDEIDAIKGQISAFQPKTKKAVKKEAVQDEPAATDEQ